MKDTIKALTEKQCAIIYKSQNCTDLMQHMKDIEVIGNLGIIKEVLRRNI